MSLFKGEVRTIRFNPIQQRHKYIHKINIFQNKIIINAKFTVEHVQNKEMCNNKNKIYNVRKGEKTKKNNNL